MTRIIIADDHKLFCDGIASMLNGDDLQVVSVAHDGTELLEQLKSIRADLILMDINMKDMGGFEASKIILQEYPGIKIIMLTMYDSSKYLKQTLQLGVQGYVLKDIRKRDLQDAIHKVMAGEKYYSQDVVPKLLDEYSSESIEGSISLSQREKDVLLLISEGYTTQEIADKLFISKNTVNSHRKNLFSKTGVSNVVRLLKFAKENGLID